jgi:hypothetical protein
MCTQFTLLLFKGELNYGSNMQWVVRSEDGVGVTGRTVSDTGGSTVVFRGAQDHYNFNP